MGTLIENILSVFVAQRKPCLADNEVYEELVKSRFRCTIDEVRQCIQRFTPQLFSYDQNYKDEGISIRVDPKIEVCDDFLNGNCKIQGNCCNQLHVCRYLYSDCRRTQCLFSHDFSLPNNRKIVQHYQCQDINPQLLVRFIYLKRSLTGSCVRSKQSDSRRPERRRRRRRGGNKKRLGRPNVDDKSQDIIYRDVLNSCKPHYNKEFSVAFRKSGASGQIDLEILGLLLKLKDIKIKNNSDDEGNEYFRKFTLELADDSDCEKLICSPIIPYEGTLIKFKFAERNADKLGFLLITPVEQGDDHISMDIVKRYASTLVSRNTVELVDISSDTEQIVLVKCSTEIDFAKLQENYSSQPDLWNRKVAIIRIYECDELRVCFNDKNLPVTENDLKRIFSSCWDDIFAFDLLLDGSAEIEFNSSTCYQKWMINDRKIQKQFNITINPLIDYVDELSDTHSFSSVVKSSDNDSTISTASTHRSTSIKMKMHRDWALVLGHKTFKAEYARFIASQFGGTVDINDENIVYNGSSPQDACGGITETIIRNKTQEFINKFTIEKLFQLQPQHIEILEENSSDVAFHHLKDQNYLVATRLNEMKNLRGKLFRSPLSNRTRFESTSNIPSLLSLELIRNEMYTITKDEQVNMFSSTILENKLKSYLSKTYDITAEIEHWNLDPGNGKKIIFRISGPANKSEEARAFVIHLFANIRRISLNKNTYGSCVPISKICAIIQHRMDDVQHICSCQTVSNTVYLCYFDETIPEFGMKEDTINVCIIDLFKHSTVCYEPKKLSLKTINEIERLTHSVNNEINYNTNMCLLENNNRIHLFGTRLAVDKFLKQIETLTKEENMLAPCKITLSDNQLKYLKYVAKNDLAQLAELYKSKGCDISSKSFEKDSAFIAPLGLHVEILSRIHLIIDEVRTVDFEINKPGFARYVDKQFNQLINLVKTKCFIEKSIINVAKEIQVSSFKLANSPQSESTDQMIANIGCSSIKILLGDITEQSVDAIVVSPSSAVLCDSIFKKAGPQAIDDYLILKNRHELSGTTKNGQLPCKRIFSIPWCYNASDPSSLRLSFSKFIETAFKYADESNFGTIAFPTVGCGGYGIDPQTVAKHMLEEAKLQLSKRPRKMTISFVIFIKETHVYNAFKIFLSNMAQNASKEPTLTNNTINPNRSTIPYNIKIVTIKLIGLNNDDLNKYQQIIIHKANEISTTEDLPIENNMEWSQHDTYEYYKFCLDKHVIPTFDKTNSTLRLAGQAEDVSEAKQHFYKMSQKTELTLTRSKAIWFYETEKNSNIWKKYSPSINNIIEKQYLQNSSLARFTNENGEECQIEFAPNLEICGGRIRSVKRRTFDSLPDTWDFFMEPVARVPLQADSLECKDVVKRFDETMRNYYKMIVKIERIQNERWYRQYIAHCDDFIQRHRDKYNERQLFHGCPSESADKIIKNCFNRSFAGVNGTLYGKGVYFHAHAKYSHDYAPENKDGEQTIFLARVLVGKSIKGSSDMITVPDGYDTTTDGENIFVVYHDAGSYADYLITYKS